MRARRYCAGSAPQLAAAAEAQGVAPLETEYLAAEREAHGLLPPWPLLVRRMEQEENAGGVACRGTGFKDLHARNSNKKGHRRGAV